MTASDAGAGSTIVAQPVAAPLTRAAIFLVVTMNPGPDSRATVRSFCGELNALFRAVEFRDLEAGLSCVMGIGSEAWDRLSEDEQRAVSAAYGSINQTPGVTPGVRMQPPELATTVRVEDGRTLTTDGPFVAVKEALGGYLFLEADDLDAAIELASRIPAASMGGAIEVRPLAE